MWGGDRREGGPGATVAGLWPRPRRGGRSLREAAGTADQGESRQRGGRAGKPRGHVEGQRDNRKEKKR